MLPMTRGMPLGSPATESVSRFRKLMSVVFLSGTLAGLGLFIVRRLTVIPLIETAETYEAAQHENSGAPHEEEGWQPADDRERTFFTALTTILTGIGFAAILFGGLALFGAQVNAADLVDRDGPRDGVGVVVGGWPEAHLATSYRRSDLPGGAPSDRRAGRSRSRMPFQLSSFAGSPSHLWRRLASSGIELLGQLNTRKLLIPRAVQNEQCAQVAECADT